MQSKWLLNDPNPSGDGGRPVVHLIAETCLGTAKKGTSLRKEVVSEGFHLGTQYQGYLVRLQFHYMLLLHEVLFAYIFHPV